MAAMIAPRERGRYSGYLGATFALATISGPLLGGLIVDTSWLGWRWCFFVGAPFALLAFVVLQKTLHLPVVRRANVSIDYLGAGLIVGGVCTLLIWVSLAGHQFAWASDSHVQRWSAVACCCSCSPCGVESRAKEPVIPLRLFRDRNTTLATIASLFVGRRPVRRHGVPQPVLPDLPRQEPDRGRPDVAADDRRPGARPAWWSAASSRAPGGTSAGWCSAACCSLPGWRLLGTIDAHTLDVAGRRLDGAPGARSRRHHAEPRPRPCRTALPSPTSASSSCDGGLLPLARGRDRRLRARRPARAPGHRPWSLAGWPGSGSRRPPRGRPAASRTSPASPGRCGPSSRTRTARRSAHVFLVAAPLGLLALLAIVAMTEVPLRRTLDLEVDPVAEPVGEPR